MQNPLKVEVGGSHYKNFKIQPVEFIYQNNLPFIEGNIVKYICRWRDKGGLKDLEKIKHYCDLLINFYEQDNQVLLRDCKEGGQKDEGMDFPRESVADLTALFRKSE